MMTYTVLRYDDALAISRSHSTPTGSLWDGAEFRLTLQGTVFVGMIPAESKSSPQSFDDIVGRLILPSNTSIVEGKNQWWLAHYALNGSRVISVVPLRYLDEIKKIQGSGLDEPFSMKDLLQLISL